MSNAVQDEVIINWQKYDGWRISDTRIVYIDRLSDPTIAQTFIYDKSTNTILEPSVVFWAPKESRIAIAWKATEMNIYSTEESNQNNTAARQENIDWENADKKWVEENEKDVDNPSTKSSN
jgi:hypothetical protein